MRELSSNLPVVLVSGYAQEKAVEHFPNNGPAAFLQKPFLPDELLQRVRSVLEA